ALEMRAVSGTYGVARSAVLAIAAGVDTVLVGHDLGFEAVAAIESALVDAVASGELSEERLREAAEHVARAAVFETTRHLPSDGDAGRVVARKALQVEGEVALDGQALVVELRPRANIAAGEAEHSLGAVLAQRRPGTDALVVRDGDAFEPAG